MHTWSLQVSEDYFGRLASHRDLGERTGVVRIFHLFMTFGDGIIAIVVLGILVHPLGTFLTRFLEDRMGTLSERRARSRVEQLKSRLWYAEQYRNDNNLLLRVMLKAIILAIVRVAIGLFLVSYPISGNGVAVQFLKTLLGGLGLGNFLSAALSLVILQLRDLDAAGDIDAFREKMKKKIARIEKGMAKSALLPEDSSTSPKAPRKLVNIWNPPPCHPLLRHLPTFRRDPLWGFRSVTCCHWLLLRVDKSED